MKTRILLIATLVLTAAVAQAQLPPGKWWQRPEIVKQLQLTREQQDKLDETFRVAATDLIDSRADIEKLQIALRGELDREQLRRPEIQKIAGQVSQARARLFERELMLLVDMRGVLNDTQWNALRSKLDQMRDRRREGEGPRPMDRRPPGGGRKPRP